MKTIFELNSLEAKLNYIEISAPCVFERIQFELEDGGALADLKNRTVIEKAVLEAFALSGNDAIITTDIYDIPAIKKYLTKQSVLHIDGKYKVIDDMCFSECSCLETLIFEEGVECIKEGVLFHSSTIKEVTFPSTLEAIGDGAFKNCINLRAVTFSNPRTWIFPKAFEGTQWFKQFTDDFVIVNGQLLKYNGNSEQVVIPEGVIDVSHSVFDGNKNLKTVICPSTLKGIWTHSFSGCVNLETIAFNNNLEMICTSAFEGCTNLREVTLPKNLKTLGYMVFGKDTIIRFYDTDQELAEQIKETYPRHKVIE